jgi:predicted nucleic acid-binding protein
VRLLLDTSVLGRICHPRKHLDVRAWFLRALVDHEMLLSEVADYELRRELLRLDSKRSIHRLDELTREIQYVPMTTATWRGPRTRRRRRRSEPPAAEVPSGTLTVLRDHHKPVGALCQDDLAAAQIDGMKRMAQLGSRPPRPAAPGARA